MTDQAGAALKLAYQGHYVLPIHSISTTGRCTCGRSCASPGKHTRTPNGPKDASAEPSTVAGWWRRWRTANVGLATGHGGLFVLDIDGDAGEETLARLEVEYEPLPVTRWVRTGSGGRHAYMRLPSGVDLGNSTRKLGPGLDTRGNGGYVVCPPSNHVSGGVYQWLNQERAAVVPTWLLELLRPLPRRPLPSRSPADRRIGHGGGPSEQRLAGLVQSVATAPEGQRNATLNWASYRAREIVEVGGELHHVAGALLDAALAAGLTETESRRTIEPRSWSTTTSRRTSTAS